MCKARGRWGRGHGYRYLELANSRDSGARIEGDLLVHSTASKRANTSTKGAVSMNGFIHAHMKPYIYCAWFVAFTCSSRSTVYTVHTYMYRYVQVYFLQYIHFE